jgi:asparagine synthase (glutamine-hydrolysing)
VCGILFTNDPRIQQEAFLDALDLMRHRGPDRPGCYAEHVDVKLGHNRLKILDLDDRSNQPFYSRDGRFVLVYNGEIYNYRELARLHAVEMQTTSDTELLIELYARFGPKMLSWLNGMFAFVIVDLSTKDVFVARDRLGVKPLYSAQLGEHVLIASEIAPILKLTGRTKIDEMGLRQYRKLRTFFGGRTLYTGISMFPAGHYALNGKVSCYWRLPEGEQAPPSDAELSELVRSAVAYRCISDVPVGSYLSGGLDSTLITALASVKDTWTVGFAGANEFAWGRLAAEHLSKSHSEVIMDRELFLSVGREMILRRQEPLSVPNEILLYWMTREVKQKNTVVLSGEGADELFFGYDRIFRWAMHNPWDIRELERLYAYGSFDDPEIIEDAIAPFMHLRRPIDRVAAFFQIAHLHGLLRRLDNSTMLCGVEARTPFVDYRLVERMAGVPATFRMTDGVVKAPLKRLARQRLPDAIVDRPKVGFPVPLAEIFPLDGGASTAMDRWFEWNLVVLTGTPSSS